MSRKLRSTLKPAPAKPTLTAFEICATNVRNVPHCGCCMHFHECKTIGKPCSRLGQYVAYLKLIKIPQLKVSLRDVCKKTFTLVTRRPTEEESDDGVVWVLRLQVGLKGRRIPLYGDMNEPLLTYCLIAYLEITEGKMNDIERGNDDEE